MDKYDILFILDNLNRILKEIKSKSLSEYKRSLYCRYLQLKKDWLMRKYYVLRIKRSISYSEKHGGADIQHGIHKALEINRRQRYMWDMFKPIKENKK